MPGFFKALLNGQPPNQDASLTVLRDTFGFDSFRPLQAEIVEHVVGGGDALVLMPTGGGKSLCFQVPALVREGVAVVVSPLIALMQDQVEALRQNGVRAAFLNSSLSWEAAQQVEHDLLAGELDLVYVAPERLMNPRMLDLFSRAKLSLFAIDEAHCVSQWGHDFRPEYRQLSVLHERFPTIPRIALTATADTPTRNEIVERLALEDAGIFVSGFDRPNIRYSISESSGNARDRLLRFIKDQHPGEAGIVYCLSRRKVDDVSEWLRQQGLDAVAYHAGLPPQQRAEAQRRFVREDGVIVVATIAFGMGIDKPDVRFVAHMNLPKSIEAYYQETGRAGRDGLPADAWMLYGLNDVITLKQMQESSEANEQYKRVERSKLDSMLGLCELTECRRQALLRYFGDEMPERCGNCDNCLNPPETWNATESAQKALSCVYRTEQRFGVTYLVDVLRGKDDQRIRHFGHDQISTYGIGQELPGTAWKDLYRQLIARGLLAVDVDGHGGLRLTEAARPILKGEHQLQLRRLRKVKSEKRSRSSADSRITEASKPLWEALREKRKELAQAQGVPAYMIFPDATLLAMIENHPEDLPEMAELPGIGSHKLEAYGEEFLAVLEKFNAADIVNGHSATVQETLTMFRAGMAIDAIARNRELKSSTILSHLADGIAAGQVDLQDVVELDLKEIEIIQNAIAEGAEPGRLKPAFDALDGAYDYGTLRCVQAAMGEG